MLTVLDVGVRGGPDPRWFPLGSNVQVIGVDADAAECHRLSVKTFPVAFRAIPAALGAREGETAILRLTRKPGCSSLLEPNHAYLQQFPYGEHFAVERTAPLTLTTLDAICTREQLWPDVLKLDTQGTELDILRGGPIAVSRTLLIEAEVEFNPLYIGQPLFGDLDACLRVQGFALLGLRRTAWRRTDVGSAGGTLVHGDALWYREDVPPPLWPHFTMALSAYQQDDFIRQLASNTKPRQRSLAQRLVGWATSTVTSHRQLRAWIDGCRPDGAVDWHDPRFF